MLGRYIIFEPRSHVNVYLDVHDRDDLTSSPLVYMGLDAASPPLSGLLKPETGKMRSVDGGASISVVKSELSLPVCLTRENLCLV